MFVSTWWLASGKFLPSTMCSQPSGHHVGSFSLLYFFFHLVATRLISCGVSPNTPPSSLMDSIASPKVKTAEGEGVRARSLAHNTLGQRGVLELRDGTKKIDKHFTYSHGLAQTKQQIDQCVIVALQCMDKAWANIGSQDSSRPRLGGSHHLPPYSTLYAWPQDQHPNVILSQDSQVGVPKFPQLGLLQLWRPITLRVDLQLR